jgi:hypothetical protein
MVVLMIKNFLLILTLAWGVMSATYYVGYNGKNDANDGLSDQTSFAHCPGDPNATAVASLTILTAGDTVNFSNSEYLSMINVNWSGAINMPIVYVGNGCLFNGHNSVEDTARYGFVCSGKKNIVIRDFSFINLGGYDTVDWTCDLLPPENAGMCISLANSDSIQIINCNFDSIGFFKNVAYSTVSRMDGNGVKISNCQQILIDSCNFSRLAKPVTVEARGDSCFGVEISNCSLTTNIRWCIELVINASNSTLKKIDIHNNVIYNTWQFNPDYWVGCPGKFPHQDGIVLLIGGGVGNQYANNDLGDEQYPINIHSNKFYNDTLNNKGGTADIFLTGFGGTVHIYNNDFRNSCQSYGAIYVQDRAEDRSNNPLPVYKIINNTFYGERSAVVLRTLNAPTMNVSDGEIVIKNNIFYKISTSAFFAIMWGYDNNSAPDTVDYNIYFTRRTQNTIVQIRENDSSKSLSIDSFKVRGWEEHGFRTLDPYFVDTTKGVIFSSQNDLSLQSISPAINAGTYVPFVSTDINGIQRDSGSVDIGAYEYYEISDTTPSAPTLTSVSPSSPRLFKTFEATGTNLSNCKLYLNSVSLGAPASATSTSISDTALGTTRGFHWLIAEDTLTGMRCSTSSRIYIKNTQLDTVLLGRP